MAMKVRVGGAWRTMTGGKVCVGGVYRTIRRVLVAADGEWKEAAVFADPLSVTAPPNVSGFVLSGSRATVTSNNATATVTGGLGPFTYLWSITASDNGTVTVGNASFKTTNFSQSLFGEQTNATAQILVTDSLGQTATATTAIILEHERSFGGA